MYLISVYFDDKTTKTLNKYITTIADKSGNTFMVDNQVPPHLTITAIEARGEEVLFEPFEKVVKDLKSGNIIIPSVGMLLPYVVYATPVLNEYLYELSQKIYDTFVQIPETQISRFYKPMQWLPHITLGKTLSKEEMKIAIDSMIGQFVSMEARVERIALSRVNPHRDISVIKLV